VMEHRRSARFRWERERAERPLRIQDSRERRPGGAGTGKWGGVRIDRPTQPSRKSAPGCQPASSFTKYGKFRTGDPDHDIVYNCNHAKWFPNGFRARRAGPFQLIVAAWQPERVIAERRGAGTYGLASLEFDSLGIALPDRTAGAYDQADRRTFPITTRIDARPPLT